MKNVLDNLDQDNIVDPQFRWEYLKYEIRKFSIHFSKGIARNKKTERMYLENKLKTLENSPFLNLENSRAVQNQIRNILIDNIEINNQKDINNELYLYYKNLFNEWQHLSEQNSL